MGEERETSITVIAFSDIVWRASDIIVTGARNKPAL
jgi:hypothetical protein